ncbi:MAG TPA: hypothetical protein VKX17_27980 [Planctomycetota bacterium]|nr:hypothetical protein [Planctomycetota bacterium]
MNEIKQPAPAGVPPGAAVVRKKKWTPPPPSKVSPTVWIIVGAAAVLAVGLVVGLHYVFAPSVTHKVLLDEEFVDAANEGIFGFRAPRHWQIDDRRQKDHFYVMGPKDNGFIPLMIFTSLAAPGKLQAFLDEEKKRTQVEEPTVKYVSEEDDCIDGCRAKRVEFDCDYHDDSNALFHLRVLQFIVKDPSFPVFYKITCYAPRDTYANYTQQFEASAHSFRRVERKVELKYLPK